MCLCMCASCVGAHALRIVVCLFMRVYVLLHVVCVYVIVFACLCICVYDFHFIFVSLISILFISVDLSAIEHTTEEHYQVTVKAAAGSGSRLVATKLSFGQVLGRGQREGRGLARSSTSSSQLARQSRPSPSTCQSARL